MYLVSIQCNVTTQNLMASTTTTSTSSIQTRSKTHNNEADDDLRHKSLTCGETTTTTCSKRTCSFCKKDTHNILSCDDERITTFANMCMYKLTLFARARYPVEGDNVRVVGNVLDIMYEFGQFIDNYPDKHVLRAYAIRCRGMSANKSWRDAVTIVEHFFANNYCIVINPVPIVDMQIYVVPYANLEQLLLHVEGIRQRLANRNVLTFSVKPVEHGEMECAICYETIPLTNSALLNCSHRFCRECVGHQFSKHMLTCALCRCGLHKVTSTDETKIYLVNILARQSVGVGGLVRWTPILARLPEPAV